MCEEVRQMKDLLLQLETINAAEVSVSQTEHEFEQNPSEANRIAMSASHARLHQALLNDEKMWCQKARMEWLQNGDRNTAFYQAFIERSYASFFWNGAEGKRRRHWIAWDQISRPKQEGGLGVRSMWHVQISLMAKLIWNAMHGQSLWSRLGVLQKSGFKPTVKLKAPMLVRWIPPSYGFCLNVDGACKGNPGPCGGGGCYRDSNRDVHLSFAYFYGQGNSVIAEVRALCDGLRLAEHRGLAIFALYSDSLVLAQSFILDICPSWKCSWWWRIAKSLLNKFNITMLYVYQETNRVADALASFACQRGNSSVLPGSSFPHICKGPVVLDKIGLPSIRLV
ncbi:hypothetical protein Taro_012139 [Colocasia esculenta]|uniref:RNase H type-1 domain-containing protein n=1 Tax=Colocasia esculenta TaxID=4460 RepID=A0A843UI72_COLES|nr:hypothetical protein [Colocasia esculenta]